MSVLQCQSCMRTLVSLLGWIGGRTLWGCIRQRCTACNKNDLKTTAFSSSPLVFSILCCSFIYMQRSIQGDVVIWCFSRS
ncbi:hypothetical protein METBIDRAFT_192799 [Metschnikowia bicuspidata var. bicuspidata NRRL YB-4993]|uniref:Uncharacterized protein n=1 Tax=Metschnikowia bicuspidata var. bicuspidata NRRL YB-4993 TaxID=869754 RepID=A0A1A0H899_9ASCO|nr:hypothetical protein METBIDRAFT_192799 [Metschnikowia bicuspidata var. bicuspidata NRRL YB-4993]OBA20205.1 hypothetical protein METBIDRAFT_192799 [Metschnikowia bicuspidata var. bicuspidata NRRL YB-4993]